MGTEDELWRGKVARALLDAPKPPTSLNDADAVLKALGIPSDVLSWITANPETAKGLASGEMVAVASGRVAELEAEIDHERRAHMRTCAGLFEASERAGMFVETDSPLKSILQEQSERPTLSRPPAPKAQGETDPKQDHFAGARGPFGDTHL